MQPIPLQNIINPESENERMIVVVGPQASGKTSFIASVTGQSVQRADAAAYTDYDQLQHDVSYLEFAGEKRLVMVAFAGAANFDSMLIQLNDYVLGIVILFDCSDARSFRETKSIIETFGWIPNYPEHNFPIVIAANPVKQIDDPWSFDNLRIALKLSAGDVMVMCDAKQHRSSADVILKLAESMPDTEFVRQLKIALA